jgi:4-amino-4-deoxy-L-arabinose transferase-like glycosyltransferase
VTDPSRERPTHIEDARERTVVDRAVLKWAQGCTRLVVEIVVLVALIALAGFLRLHDLVASPPGLHGDEAITGIEGRRILAQGWIGPYSPLALGQPSGPLYLTATSVRLFGNTILAVRIVPALLGTLTIVALYLVLRRNSDAPTALAGAGLLAVMGWHLHYSRIGFPLAAWPLIVVIAAGVALEAVRGEDPGWWAAAGFFAGLGTYVYNAHPLVLLIIAGFALAGLMRGRIHRLHTVEERGRLICLCAFVGALALTLLPMARFAADARNGYWQHFQAYSLFNQPVWSAAPTMTERALALAGRYAGFWNHLCCQPVLDSVDGTGLTAIVPPAFLAVSAVGLALALWRRSGAWAVLGALLIGVVPLAAVVTIEGMARRTFVMAPFLAAFAGYGMVALWRAAARQSMAIRLAGSAALLAVTGLAVYQNLDDEIRIFARSPQAAWVFAREMTDAADFMRCLQPDQHVYFLSDRWSVNYETRQFLAPHVSAEDRSAEFGHYDLRLDPARSASVFLLLGRYIPLLGELQERYPGGETVLGRTQDEPTFAAYFVPPAIVIGTGEPASRRLLPACRNELQEQRWLGSA